VSAQTARLAVTPAPQGQPGGPGLWRVKGMMLPPYFENIRNALERSGHTPGDAYRITWGAIRRWAHGGGKVHPEVVAAAQAALADLKAKAAIAHSHANEDGTVIDLAGPEGYIHGWIKVGAGNGGGIQKTANAVTMDPGRKHIASLSTSQLRAVDKELASRAAKTGHAGQLSRAHKAVRAELAHRAAGGASAVSAANENGGAMALTWNGMNIDAGDVLAFAAAQPAPAAADSSGIVRVPAGNGTASGEFGSAGGTPAAAPAKKGTAKPAPKSTSKSSAAAAKQAAEAKKAQLRGEANSDRAKAKSLNAQIKTLMAAITQAKKAASSAAASGKQTAAATTSAAASVAASSTTSAAPASVTKSSAPTVAQMQSKLDGMKAQVKTLNASAAGLDKQAAAIKLAGDGAFLDLAFTEALAGRVPPGHREGGRFVPAVPVLTRHDTPDQAARAINAMERLQRAAVRASTLPPPGYDWGSADRLTSGGSIP
jgi:hypothetical protein